MLRTRSLLRPRTALALAATAAAALTTACSDDPVSPDRSVPAAAVGAARAAKQQTPVPALVRSIIKVASSTNMKDLVPGTVVRFTTDKGTVLVTDNVNPDGLGDMDAAAGAYGVYLPFGSTHYKAEVVSVPVGFQMPQTTVYYGKLTTTAGSAPETIVSFPTAIAPAKKQLRINFLDMQKAFAPGATVAVTPVGWDLLYTITDGGAGDLLADGTQGPADGQVTVFAPVPTIAKWKVCETAAPTGFLLTEPGCRTVDMPAAQWTSTVNLFHQGGILPPPPSM